MGLGSLVSLFTGGGRETSIQKAARRENRARIFSSQQQVATPEQQAAEAKEKKKGKQQARIALLTGTKGGARGLLSEAPVGRRQLLSA